MTFEHGSFCGVFACIEWVTVNPHQSEHLKRSPIMQSCAKPVLLMAHTRPRPPTQDPQPRTSLIPNYTYIMCCPTTGATSHTMDR